jgi:hypothetical protein
VAKKYKRQVRRDVNPAQGNTGNDPLLSSRQVGFTPDYHFVIRDVRRVGILAGSFIVVLVILSFFLH